MDRRPATSPRKKRTLPLSDRAIPTFEAIAEHCPAGIVIIRGDGQIVYTNARAREMIGLSREAYESRSYNAPQWHVTDFDGRPQKDDELIFARVLKEARAINDMEHAVERADGQRIYLRISGQPLLDAAGHVERVIFTMMDVGSAVIAERTRRRSEERFANALEYAPIGMALVSTEGRFLLVNQALCNITGYEKTELEQLTFQDITHPDDLASDMDNVRDLLSGRAMNYRMEKRYLHKQGHQVWIRLSASLLRDESGAPLHFISQIEDITEQKRREAYTQHIAEHDHLTGLPNRLLLLERLTTSIERARNTSRQVAVLMIDLDHFKRVNDSLGHHTGDELLKSVTQRILSCVRATDTVARMGGDEFVVVLPDLTDPEAAEDIAVKIIGRVMAPVNAGPYELVVTPSIGISRYPLDGSNANMLLKNADTAMYRAKARGRCSFEVFDPDIEAQAVHAMGLEAELRKGLRENQLELHYQPQICLRTGRIVAVEALVRWRHPERGLIPPDQFIPLAEQCGLIVALGEWVLRTACRDARQIQRCAEHPVVMAVNLSLLQFRHNNLVQMVRSALLEGCLAPELLELEITESVLMDNYEDACSKLQSLRDLGVSLAIDDFGTGFSSLAHLSRLPINALKIDRGFTGKMMGHHSDAVIVQAIMAMARSLSIKVVAEGVETRAQLQRLRELQCDVSQGFLFSVPLPVSALCGAVQRKPARSRQDETARPAVVFRQIEQNGVKWVTGRRLRAASSPVMPKRARPPGKRDPVLQSAPGHAAHAPG